MHDILPRRWFFGEPRRFPIHGAEGFSVHVGCALHNTIVFIGSEDPTRPSGIDCQGTGFLLHYDGCGYLVTARHVAEPFESAPFVLRVNNGNSSSRLLPGEEVTWFHHSDRLVDLSVSPVNLTLKSGYRVQFLTKDFLVSGDVLKSEGIEI